MTRERNFTRSFLGRYGPVESIGWVLPIDDTHFRSVVAGRVEQADVARGPDAEATQRFADGGNFIAA